MHTLRLLWAAKNEESWLRRQRRLKNRRRLEKINSMPENVFIDNFRLNKDKFYELCNDLRELGGLKGTCELPLEIKILCALSFFATGSYQRIVGITQHIIQRTVSRCIREVVDALNMDAITEKWIVFPKTHQERSHISQEFQRKYGLPGVIGCIDGTHVAIVKPNDNEHLYINRKGYHSLNVQMICDANLRILSVNPKFGGCTHDSHIWSASRVETYMRELHQNGEQVWLLGDSGYPQRPWLMTPILNAAHGSREEMYTMRHVQARNCIERCFGLLKSRWRCLLKHRTLHYQPVVASKMVVACSVLHNMALTATQLAIPQELVVEDAAHDAEPIQVDVSEGESELIQGRAMLNSLGLPSWSRGLEAAEAARARLVRWACGEALPEDKGDPPRKMPHALRRRWPLCPCFQNDEPPEITYCVVGGEGGLALQAVTPTHPMPPPDELDAMFAELVEELDLTAVNKAAMMQLPPEKKWQIYCSRRPPPGQSVPPTTTPQVEDYIKALSEIADAFVSSEGTAPVEASALLDGLKTALRTRAHSFVLRFTKLGGLGALLDALQRAPRDDAVTRHNLIAAIKALMNNSTGRAHVLAHPTSIDLIAQALDTENVKTKVAALEILGAVCLVPGGHKKVLEAMIHYQKYAGERARFQGIVNELDRSTGAYRDDLGLKTAIMSFINAVLNYGPGEESLEFRLHLRYELLMLGIQPVIEKLRKYENETLDRHIDFFEMIRNEDEKELARRFDKQHVDTKSASAMFELLRRKISHTAAYPHMLSLLQHLLLIPLEYNPHTQHWLLLDRVCQQLVLQQTASGSRASSVQGREISTSDSENTGINKVYDPDVAPLEINVSEIVHLLAKEEELVAARTKAENLEKENIDLATELAKKEKQLDQQSQEKEELEASITRMKERLERETAAHMESTARQHRLEQQLNQERSERARFEKLVSEGSIPDDAKVSNLKSAVIETCSAPPPPPPPSLCPPPPPLAPPAPLAPMAPPVPPAPKPKKNVPTPGNPLKSFNWSKLPDVKLHGTIWQELDDTKLYSSMDLHAIDKMFCAYQKNGVQNEGSVEDLRQLGSKPRTKILTVIDGRRAQNCTILLSKLKMTDEEICRAILRMDSNEQLPIDMVEQLLKFTPSAEEAALLEEHQDELENMARADRFLYEISKIPHYSQRVRTLLFKKKFNLAAAEASSRASTVLRAARDMRRSRRLRALLELVLALGNYMNRGARGNASGFRLTSLNKLADTKSSVSRSTTLLHYLVELLESQFKDILLLEEDLPHVRAAAKICVDQLEKDVNALQSGLREVSRELEYHAAHAPVSPYDAFLPVMREFHAHALCAFTQLQDLFQDMKSRLESCAHAFGEEPSASPEQLFGALDLFLTQLAEARSECDAARRRRDEEERRTRHEQELKKRTMERKQASSLLSSVGKSLGIGKSNGSPNCNGHNTDSSRESSLTNGQKGEFDDLISALRTGDVFGDDVAKFKRSRKTSKASHKGRDSPPRGICREDSRERQKN